MAKESPPKAQALTRPGIEPGTPWLPFRDLTNCANLADTSKSEELSNSYKQNKSKPLHWQINHTSQIFAIYIEFYLTN